MVLGRTQFDLLLVGLASWLEQQTYPFPALLQASFHLLSIHMQPYPKTLTGLLGTMERPVSAWWPSDDLPPEFDSRFGLLDEGQLSEEASRYLYQDLGEHDDIMAMLKTEYQQVAVENAQLKRLIETIRAFYEHDPHAAQTAYCRLRTFLIQHPYATPQEMSDAVYGLAAISVADIGALYSSDDLLLQQYWVCDHCGPLTERRGRLYGINELACSDHRRGLPFVREVPWRPGLRRITKGIHLRTCLPGLPELRLFEVLKQHSQNAAAYLNAVHLWPGIDRYDLQLVFADGTVWAVDVKDYGDPRRVAQQLGALYGEGSLRYDRGFYVIPMRRLRTENYLELATQAAHELPPNIEVISEEDLQHRIRDYIDALRKGS